MFQSVVPDEPESTASTGRGSAACRRRVYLSHDCAPSSSQYQTWSRATPTDASTQIPPACDRVSSTRREGKLATGYWLLVTGYWLLLR